MQRRFLMCRPSYFAVTYKINPWMDPSAPYDTSLAIDQWESLVSAYKELGHRIDFIEPLPGLPDMVFAANGGTVIDGKMFTAQFRHAERADEAPAYRDWAERAGFEVHEAKHVNEGEGDLLLAGDYLLAGTGFRTAHAAHLEAQELFGRPVISLQLVDPRFYHLDTAIAVLSGSNGEKPANIAYLPEAFSPGSQAVLRQLYPNAVIANVADGEVLGLNAVSDGHNVVLAVQATNLANELRKAGYNPVPVDVSELRLAGGGPKCCTLELRSA
ncbi:MAG TPA: amidinotransferase [Micromonosporaceae bacterium]|nr:amidinotransferase [Micromonosporaceae bacterium]HCU51678.1 amidinotransferase [Micromonosporaceae bacterium]